MLRRLIYDVGANDGRDTEFYLGKGFDVVAVEANPRLSADIEARFSSQIQSGALKVLNVGVSDRAETLDLYVNEFDEWSSFVENSKATKKLSHTKVSVPTMSLADMLHEHGTPYYLKMDIEGFEARAITTLAPDMDLPVYLSLELSPGWRDSLRHLHDLGFESFQIARQGKEFLAAQPDPSPEGTRVDVKWTNAHSGCFGLDLVGEWVDVAGIHDQIGAETAQAQARSMRGEKPGWWDIHCRRDAAL